MKAATGRRGWGRWFCGNQSSRLVAGASMPPCKDMPLGEIVAPGGPGEAGGGRDDAKAWIIGNQLSRRNLPDYQKARLVLLRDGIYKAQAKERQREHGGTAPGRQKETLIQHGGEVILEGNPGVRTDERLAREAGVSHYTIHKVRVIEREASPEVEAAPEEIPEKNMVDICNYMSIELRHHETITDEHSRRPSQETQKILLRDGTADDGRRPEADRGFPEEGRGKSEKITAEAGPPSVASTGRTLILHMEEP